ncbi:hypothetical protein V5O48_014123 [Marasmius crinis-equi]|uniref:Uncharacterized protein n=1 Tax=Marasmius crinis-equi TaxID=585013 RepID=A0ABR3EYJ3_9AGAR
MRSKEIDTESLAPPATCDSRKVSEGTQPEDIGIFDPVRLPANMVCQYTERDVRRLQMIHPLSLPPRRHGWKKTEEGIWVERKPEQELKEEHLENQEADQKRKRKSDTTQWSRQLGGRLRPKPKRHLIN